MHYVVRQTKTYQAQESLSIMIMSQNNNKTKLNRLVRIMKVKTRMSSSYIYHGRLSIIDILDRNQVIKFKGEDQQQFQDVGATKTQKWMITTQFL